MRKEICICKVAALDSDKRPPPTVKIHKINLEIDAERSLSSELKENDLSVECKEAETGLTIKVHVCLSENDGIYLYIFKKAQGIKKEIEIDVFEWTKDDIIKRIMSKPRFLSDFLKEECKLPQLVGNLCKDKNFMINFNPSCLRKSSDEMNRLLYNDV